MAGDDKLIPIKQTPESAAYHLSQLQFFDMAEKGLVHAAMPVTRENKTPAAKDIRAIIAGSLKSAGFNIDGNNDIKNTGGVRGDNATSSIYLLTDLATSYTLTFDSNGVQALIDAGVVNPVLDMAAEKMDIRVPKRFGPRAAASLAATGVEEGRGGAGS